MSDLLGLCKRTCEGGVEIGIGEGLGDAVAPGDLGAPRGMGFAEGDRVATVELLEDAEVPFADGAGADDKESHGKAQSTRVGHAGNPSPSGRVWQRARGSFADAMPQSGRPPPPYSGK